jgi:hypothetical protein
MACAFPGAVPGSLKVSCLGQRPATKRAEAAGAHLCCVFPSDGHHGQPGPGLTFGAVFLARLRTSATNWSDAVQVLSFNAPWDGCSEWQPSPRADLCRPGLFSDLPLMPILGYRGAIRPPLHWSAYGGWA